MQRQPSITFHGLDHSDALEAEIKGRIDDLETYYPAIVGCRVVVGSAQRHHESGNRYQVRIEISVPGPDIVVSHEPSLHGSARATRADRTTKDDETDPERKDVRVAVREAFDVARRQLQDYARKQRDHADSSPPRGRNSA